MTKAHKPSSVAKIDATAKPPTKLERIIAMLGRPEGASVAQISQMTGWKPNSVRGALAGALKARGVIISSEKPAGERIYRAKTDASA